MGTVKLGNPQADEGVDLGEQDGNVAGEEGAKSLDEAEALEAADAVPFEAVHCVFWLEFLWAVLLVSSS